MSYEVKDWSGKLAKGFIRNPLTLLMGLFILAIGYISLEIMPREENPQMVVSGSSIIVVSPGHNAEQINEVIVKPLERKIKEIKGIENIDSVAYDNYAVVNASFFIGEEKKDSDVKIYDKIMQNLDFLPEGTMQPLIKPLDIDTHIPIMSIAFYSDKANILEVSDFTRNLQHKINALENVAVTELKGLRNHQFNIFIDNNKLSHYNLSLGQILNEVKKLNSLVPEMKIDTKEGNYVVANLNGAIESIKDLENILVFKYRNKPIYLKDIAVIEHGYNENSDDMYLITDKKNDTFLEQQVTLTVSKLKGTNSVNITDDIISFLEENKDFLQNNFIKYTITKNDGKKANDAVNELVYHLLLSIFIIALLLIFVLGFKESLIVTFTVPAILAITLFIAFLGDQTINRITLFAFLLSLGLLVDAAIIVIENIHRHFHLEHNKDRDLDEVLIEATDEVGPPTNIATLAIILTMVPMAFVGGMMGQFMKPIPYNVPVALIASLFIAYIFTPYLAARLMKKNKGKH